MSKPRLYGLVLWAALSTSLLAPRDGQAARLGQIFPELAERKSQLGRTLVLVDVVLVDDIAGTIEKVKLGRSWELAQLAASALRDSLASRGYVVDSVLVSSIGLSLDLMAPYQSDSLQVLSASDTLGVIRAPFYVDSLLSSPERISACREFMGSMSRYERKKGKPPGYVTETIALGSQLGCDTVGMLMIGSWGIPTTKKVLQALVGVQQSSMTTYRFVLADARTGEVHWKTWGYFNASADEIITRKCVAGASEQLP